MKWSDANDVVEGMRVETQLYLPPLTKRRGFSSSRVEHLLNRLVRVMPQNECYLEVGTLEGRTLDAAAVGNETKKMYGVDKCEKYDTLPDPFPSNVVFIKSDINMFLKEFPFTMPIGLCFYDADHSEEATKGFFDKVTPHMADEGVLVLDDWDRETVRRGAFHSYSMAISSVAGMETKWQWRLLREMPSYGDGINSPQDHFGWSFGVSVWGFKRSW